MTSRNRTFYPPSWSHARETLIVPVDILDQAQDILRDVPKATAYYPEYVTAVRLIRQATGAGLLAARYVVNQLIKERD